MNIWIEIGTVKFVLVLKSGVSCVIHLLGIDMCYVPKSILHSILSGSDTVVAIPRLYKVK